MEFLIASLAHYAQRTPSPTLQTWLESLDDLQKASSQLNAIQEASAPTTTDEVMQLAQLIRERESEYNNCLKSVSEDFLKKADIIRSEIVKPDFFGSHRLSPFSSSSSSCTYDSVNEWLPLLNTFIDTRIIQERQKWENEIKKTKETLCVASEICPPDIQLGVGAFLVDLENTYSIVLNAPVAESAVKTVSLLECYTSLSEDCRKHNIPLSVCGLDAITPEVIINTLLHTVENRSYYVQCLIYVIFVRQCYVLFTQ